MIILSPVTGLRDSTIYPSEPGSEAAAREQIQSVIDQVVTQANEMTQGYQIVNATRDLTIIGVQTISGILGIPKKIEIIGNINGTKHHSEGSWAGHGGQFSVTRTIDNDVYYDDTTNAISFNATGADIVVGKIQNVINGSFEINYQKYGAGVTGTASLHIIISY